MLWVPSCVSWDPRGEPLLQWGLPSGISSLQRLKLAPALLTSCKTLKSWFCAVVWGSECVVVPISCCGTWCFCNFLLAALNFLWVFCIWIVFLVLAAHPINFKKEWMNAAVKFIKADCHFQASAESWKESYICFRISLTWRIESFKTEENYLSGEIIGLSCAQLSTTDLCAGPYGKVS